MVFWARNNCNGTDRIRVIVYLERPYSNFSYSCIPDSDCPVQGARNDVLTVLRERNGGDRIGVSLERPKTTFPLSASQTRIVLSWEPETMCLLSLENATEVTPSVCPVSGPTTTSPVSASQTRIVLSQERCAYCPART